MPPVPGTSSSTRIAFCHRARIVAARPEAFGPAPQGTQYSMRIVCTGFIAMEEPLPVASWCRVALSRHEALLITWARYPRSVHTLSARALAAAVTAGDLSAEEVTRHHLDRIAANGHLNAVITSDAEGALAAARRLPAGPLAGVPLIVKDLIDTAGLRTTYGSPIFAEHVPERTATAVQRLLDAGCILLGKANLHEFAWGVVSRNRTYGTVRNPLRPDRIPGGSSGGNAAALAAGLCALGLGTDTGGSIRIPSAACGTAGFKTTAGLVPLDGVWPLAPSSDGVGPMARSIDDCALALAVLTGLPEPVPHLEGLRIGRDVEVPDSTHLLRWQFGEVADVHRELFAAHAEAYDPELRAKLAVALTVTPEERVELQRGVEAWRRRCEDALPYDVVISATIPGELPAIDCVIAPELNERLTRLTRPYNLLGWASATCRDGTMLSGRDDATVLGAALAWEEGL